MKKFEKVEKTGIISTKFSLLCTPSVILGVGELAFEYFGGSEVVNKVIFYHLDKWTWTGLLAANDVAYADNQVISKVVAKEAETNQQTIGKKRKQEESSLR